LIFFYVLLMSRLTLDHLPADVWATYRRWTFRQIDVGIPHDHTFMELFWVEEGEGVELHNGRERTLRFGDLALIRARDAHAFAARDSSLPFSFVNIAFPLEMWRGQVRRWPEFRGRFFDDTKSDVPLIRLSEVEIAYLRQGSYLLQSGVRDKLTVDSFLSSVLALLSKREKSHRSRLLPDWLAKAYSTIQIHPHFRGGTASFARLAGRCPEHVAREARRHLGRTPTDIVNEARLLYASEQLSVTNRAIVEIAGDCGWDNLGYFYDLFRARFKTSPRRYRYKHRQVL
jgi:AraC family cel operon transcriptional repressor